MILSKEEIEKLALAKYPEENEFDYERSKYMDGWYDKNERVREAFKEGLFTGMTIGNKYERKREIFL